MVIFDSLDRKMVQMCRGAMNKKELGLWSRRGLLAYVYTGVFE